MSIALLEEEPLENRSALFEDDQTQGADEGSIEWTLPTETSHENWQFTFEGTDTGGETIEPTTKTMPSPELPSPSQVFWWIADKLKSTLCPTCI